MNIHIFLSCILLLPVIYCSTDNLDDHEEKKVNWIKFLPSHVQDIVQSRRTTLTVSNEESNEDVTSTETPSTGETTDLSVAPELMHDYGDNRSSNKSVPIGFSVGGIIVLACICFCCYRCCCRNRNVSHGVIIHQPQPPPPPPQNQNQPNVVIQHIHPTPNYQPSQPAIVQHVHHQAQPPMVHPPQFQQQPHYPTNYDTRQMLQQEWSPHAPMNQQLEQYPAQDPYNPTAPPPSYGKY